MNRGVVICAIIGALLTLNSVWGDDYNPPEWRGEENTTFAQWEFGGSSATPSPDSWFGISVPSLTVVGNEPKSIWLTAYLGRSGVWRFEDYIQIEIENYDEVNPIKEIWIQLTYNEEPAFIYANPGAFLADEIDREATGDYWHVTYQIIMTPNPASETIYLQPTPCTMYLDEIVIDTRCVPEPTTICLLGLGALALLRKRRS